MANKHKKIWILGSLVTILIAAVLLLGNVVAKRIIQKKFDTVLNQFRPFVLTRYASLQINLLTGSFSIDSLFIQYTPQPSRALEKSTAYFPSVTINGISYFKLISGNNFSASVLKLNNTLISVDSTLQDKKDTIGEKIFSSIQLPFKNISLHEIEVSNASVKRTSSKTDLSLFDGNIIINDINLRKTGQDFSTDSISFGDMQCSLNNINYPLPGYHAMHISHVMISSRDSLLKIDSLQLVPQLNKYDLGKMLGHQADHINAVVSSINIKGLDVKKLFQKKLIADEMIIGKSNVYVFRDRRLSREIRTQPTSAEYLKKIPFDVYINHFKLNDATITSEEFPKDGNHTGYIKISDINISMRPLFNRSNNKNAALTAAVRANIMNAGSIHAIINLSLTSGNEHIEGAIESLHLTALNPSAENLGRFHIESGLLNHLNFSFTANREKASGEITGVYHDLVVDRLKATKDGELKKATIPTFALKTFIVPKNKDASMPIERRTGKIDYTRDPTRLVSFFYLKALLDGIRNSFSLGFLLPN